ncbi:MAG: helix-turn-helix domain-containing protein [Inquilinus sp.]|nr:helix-turn-helix domain-containing protein [Inquilinus sp.]
MASLQDRLLVLGRKSTEEKLAAFILEFCRPSGALSGLGREIHLPMRRSDIAEYLALTTESVSREFSRLKRDRIIAMPRPSRVVVLNRPALEAAARGQKHGAAARRETSPDSLGSRYGGA